MMFECERSFSFILQFDCGSKRQLRKRSVKTSPNARLSKPERDQLRREQIAEAARRCMLQQGFHRASMAQVAQAAGMSVGQIYRYFVNKEAIIEFIVGQHVSARLAWIASTVGPDDAVRFLVARLTDEDARGERALLLEIQAEAARNPAVAAIVRAADQLLHVQAVATVRAQFPDLDDEEAAARVEVMATLAEGSLFRGGMRPAVDPQRLTMLYGDIVALLFGAGPARSQARA
jgi:AcrR family transcriptional regulator